MKKIFTFLAAVLLTASVFAQSPEKMSYQAVIRDATDSLVASQTTGMQISILQGSASGNAVYVETQTPTTNANGLVSLEIGTGTTSDDFSAIDWGNGPYFIKTETDPAGGTDYTITGTSQLLSVPYALHAKTADSISGGTAGGFTHYIGEQFGGGVIFHLWKDAQGVERGLIVDLVDLSISQVWSNVDNLAIGAVAQSIWDGLTNSNAIIAQSGHINSAAALCLSSTNGGFNDWYLPSVKEADLLVNQIFNVNKTLNEITGATQISVGDDGYWSSTELYSECCADYEAWFFGVFFSGTGSKNSTKSIRAIRAF